MTNNISPTDPHSLSEEDLVEVTGGSGHWDINEENTWLEKYRRDPFHTVQSFDDYLAKQFKGTEDGSHMLQARSLWVRSGKPLHIQVRVDDRGRFDMPWAI